MNKEKEVWRNVVGYEFKYEVSNLGNVRSLPRYLKCNNGIRFHRGRLLSQGTTKEGYKIVVLAPDTKMYYVHRLVAEAFIPNPDNLPIINHKDENRINNVVDNLEWCTCKYNLNYSNVGTKINMGKRKPIMATNVKTGHKQRFVSITEAILNGFDKRNIYRCLSGIYKTHRGYAWSYL